MKIDLAVLNPQKTQSTTGVKKMRLSENAQSMVFQLFTKNVYSNPIGTIVREITSNCFDSHVEANVDTPVIIKKSYDNETKTHYISFIDFGVGMSPERIENIYMVYFESTKRADNTQIGGFGIGGKTPLAYRRSTGQGENEYDNSFYVITNYNGRKYYYCIYEGTNSPEVSLLHEEDTTEHNGTEVRIPVQESDIKTFEREMVRQLYYFENIIFEGFEQKNSNGDIIGHSVSNEYQIIRGKTFWFRGKDYNQYIHVCLGRVAYPINYNDLGIDDDSYKLPVAIKLEVGDINVTASRENLDYNKETKAILIKKLNEVREEIHGLLKEKYKDVRTLVDYYNVRENFGNYTFPNGEIIYVGNIIDKADIDYTNFRFNNFKLPDDKTLFSLLFNYKEYGKKKAKSSGRRRRRYNNDIEEYSVSLNTIKNRSNILHITGEFNRKIIKQSWLAFEYKTFYIISKKSISDIQLDDVFGAFKLSLNNIPAKSDLIDVNGNILGILKTITEIQDEYFEHICNHTPNYDEIEVPEDFVESRKRDKLSVDILKSTIPVTFARYKGNYRVKVEEFVKFNGTIVYTTKNNSDILYRAWEAYSTLFDKDKCADYYYNSDDFKNKGIMFIQLAQNNLKYMEYCHKAYPVEQIYQKLFFRKEELVKNEFVNIEMRERLREISALYLSETMKRLSSTWGKKIKKLLEYKKNMPVVNSKIYNNQYELKTFYKLGATEFNKEQKEVLSLVEEFIKLQERNEKIMKFVYLPHNLDEVDNDLLLMLAKIMDLK